MISVYYKEQGDQFWIETSGHAEPIVCAAVSGLIQALAQRMEDLSGKTVPLHVGDNRVHGAGADEMSASYVVLAGIRRMVAYGAPIDLVEEHV